ncbi:ThuA domain-containing protein [Chitinophaga sancti]|uniref:ThuA domain-containing protein n=1 Tax=Chitinophaga sancti TaxID=1004 RepID=A0A1K1SRK5_9BACT|nr:ThuA domain-containing protein [Chitinophaga sancti]WQD65309.1 ThuA domain-containing protein [Chitinophaga sancti]WQG89067.1 ThuA domain-containing protein [Chitinophaga sancti]SFW86945.1 Trehalose utilisation [Chitinophaga sancti]
MKRTTLFLACLLSIPAAFSQKILAFYTAKEDQAHISFVHEANKWFPATLSKYNWTYDATNDWSKCNLDTLSKYNVVLFLDTRPEDPAQRADFQKYMERGGAWMGFHFSAFALTPSAYNQDWNWYHNTFLGSGTFVSNTWRPAAAVLRVEHREHKIVQELPDTFRSAPNEWYRWSNDLRRNKDIRILLSIDPASFPLGTGPKPNEIWHSGYYPVAWTNQHYKMVYMNMGHNDIDYEHGTNKELSYTFSSPDQNRFILNALFYLVNAKD